MEAKLIIASALSQLARHGNGRHPNELFGGLFYD
jgi:hypothetical protein